MASFEKRIASLEKSNQALQSTMLDGFASLQRSIGAAAAAAAADGAASLGGGGGRAARNSRASRNSVAIPAEDTGPGSKEVYAALMDFVDGGDGEVPSQSDVDPVMLKIVSDRCPTKISTWYNRI